MGEVDGDTDLFVSVGEDALLFVRVGDAALLSVEANVPTTKGRSTVMNCDFVPSDVVYTPS